MMAKCYQLVGVPGSGKSTWAAQHAHCSTIISTDHFIEEYAKKHAKTYSEVFREHIRIANRKMLDLVASCRENNLSVVWDQTNLTIASRKVKFKALPNHEHIAVVFQAPNPEQLVKRLASRPGKHIQLDLVTSMLSRYQVPTTIYEGFKEVWFVAA